ncbi:hypothetical protein J4471_02870 [Candidatus Woesearchaeota archaeon]|nr:hypothetical protein [Candidatus Woesearchaeota archaeon]
MEQKYDQNKIEEFIQLVNRPIVLGSNGEQTPQSDLLVIGPDGVVTLYRPGTSRERYDKRYFER